MPPEAIDLASRLLQYSPSLRCTAVSLFFPSCNESYLQVAHYRSKIVQVANLHILNAFIFLMLQVYLLLPVILVFAVRYPVY